MKPAPRTRSENRPARSTARRIAPFVAAQLLIVGIAAAGITYRSLHLRTAAALPELRETPREVAPLWGEDEPEVIGADQLQRVLRKLRPTLPADKTVVGHVDHNLRFWGAPAKFDDPRFVSGEQMRQFLLNHERFRDVYEKHEDAQLQELVGDWNGYRKKYGAEAFHAKLRELWPVYDALPNLYDRPQAEENIKRMLLDFPQFQADAGAEAAIAMLDQFLHDYKLLRLRIADEKPLLLEVDDQPGVRFRDLEGPRSSSHNDHTLACLAEVGTPLSYPVVTPQRETTFRDIVEQSLRDFSLNQREYEWSTLAFVLFIKDTNHWTTADGQDVSFDMLAERIMRQEMPQGVCMGNHRLHALVMMLRVDDMWDGPEPMLSPAMREKIVEYLGGITKRLVAHQHKDGFWNSKWPTAKPASSTPTEVEGDRLGDRVIATGHTLEWWALVPKKDRSAILPPIDVLRRAAQWLTRTVDEMSEDDVRRNNSFLSHAGRALTLWRGKYPYQVSLSEPPESSARSDQESQD